LQVEVEVVVVVAIQILPRRQVAVAVLVVAMGSTHSVFVIFQRMFCTWSLEIAEKALPRKPPTTRLG